jgi:hypothetical protein
MKNLTTNNSTNDLNPIDAPKIRKLKSRVRKPKRSDIKWSNPCVDQAIHFIDCNENPNAENFCYNCKKTRITFDTKPITICISSINERKTQVGWIVDIGQRMQR